MRLWDITTGRCLHTLAIASLSAAADTAATAADSSSSAAVEGFVLRVACCPGRDLAVAIVANSRTAKLLRASADGLALVAEVEAPGHVWSACFAGEMLWLVSLFSACFRFAPQPRKCFFLFVFFLVQSQALSNPQAVHRLPCAPNCALFYDGQHGRSSAAYCQSARSGAFANACHESLLLV